MKNKLLISILTMFIVLLILPLSVVNSVEAKNGMGLMMIFFFAINPITTICLNLMINKDIKKMWCIPILFSFIFLLSYWIVLKEVITDLIIYAVIYLVLGVITMFLSYFLNNRRKK